MSASVVGRRADTLPTEGQIVTFYSYKGGTGRTMTVANLAWILASNGYRVLAVDWDLESPGLHRYFHPFLLDKQLRSSSGVIEMIRDFAAATLEPSRGDDEHWFDERAQVLNYATSLEWQFAGGGGIDLLPAGRQDRSYARSVSTFDWPSFYERLGGGAFIDALGRNMRQQYDYVLIDSRTGVSDTAGISTVQMPDMLVVCFTLNNQSIEGASSVTLNAFDQHKQTFYRGYEEFRVVPVPTRIEQAEQDMLKRGRLYARWRFKELVEPYIPAGDVKAFWNAVEVPYLPYFAFYEILAPFREDATDPKTCLAAFVRIANQIAAPEKLNYVSLIAPEQQAAVLKEFASTPVPAPGTRTAPVAAGVDISVAPESGTERQLREVETVFANLGEQEREGARRLWTRLVRVPRYGEGVDVTKVRVPSRDLDGLGPIIEKFMAQKLLVQSKDPETGQETVEAASDQLVREWRQLGEWIKAEGDLLLWRQHLQAGVMRWAAGGRKDSELLNGDALAEAGRWYEHRRADLNAAEVEYIQFSISRRKARHRLYRRIAYGAAAALVLIVAALLVTNRYVASMRKQEAAQKLADEAVQQLRFAPSDSVARQADQLQLGLLLAVEGARLSPKEDSNSVVLRAYLPALLRRAAVNMQDENVLSLALTDDGKTFVSVTGRARTYDDPRNLQEDRTVQWQEVETGKVLVRRGFGANTRAYDVSPDGRYLALAADAEGGARKPGVSVIGIAKETEIRNVSASALKFSPDGRFIAATGDNYTVRLFDVNGESLSEHKFANTVLSVAFSPDSKFCAISSDAPSTKVVPVPEKGKGNAGTPPPAVGLKSAALYLALSPQGRYLAAVTYIDRTAFTVWDARSGEQFGKRMVHGEIGDDIDALAFSPDGRFLVTTGARGSIRVWRVGQDGVTQFKDLKFDGDVYRLAFSRGGEYMVAVGASNIACLWAVGAAPADGQADDALRNVSFLITEGNVVDVAFSGDGSLVATAGADKSVRVWYANSAAGGDLKNDEPCARLTRNMRADEWYKFMPEGMPFVPTCPKLGQSAR
jgi:WD40 repeat protein/MinD-like ATPase involved in chromosome partitioning or flagellar assembly